MKTSGELKFPDHNLKYINMNNFGYTPAGYYDADFVDYTVNSKSLSNIDYLRNFEQVSYVQKVSGEPEAQGVILPADAPALARCVGLRFRLRSTWPGQKRPLLEWLRWWTEYNSLLSSYQTNDEIVLWVQSPRAQEGQ